MGYGHQRAAYPLSLIALGGRAQNANDYDGIPVKDRKIWESSRAFYEFISRFSKVPLIGSALFALFDKFQQIASFYPRRNLSESNLSLKKITSLIIKGWGKDLVRKLDENPLPLVSTFFVPAFMAEHFGYKNDIYCLATDTDIARTWAPMNPAKSRIIYFAPTEEVRRRLVSYGVAESSIHLTGFPLPDENIGGPKMSILRSDLACRLANLDPKKTYRQKYYPLIDKYLPNAVIRSRRKLSLIFSLGGAGAQREIAVTVMRSLKQKIASGEVELRIAAGSNAESRKFFRGIIDHDDFKELIGNGLSIIEADDALDYFRLFNESLRSADILWTKPSELSFYCALGIPIIIAPPIGSQEAFNKEWLMRVGAGVPQNNPMYADEWLIDLVHSGFLAEAAMQGFIEVEKFGLSNIENVIMKNSKHHASAQNK